MKSLVRIALPATAEQFLQAFMGLVDTYLVAHLGLMMVSGVSVANTVLAVYQAIWIAFGTAVTARFAAIFQRNEGLEQKEEAYTSAVIVALVMSLVMGLFSLVLAGPLLPFFGLERGVQEAAAHYLSIVGGGTLGLGMMTTLGGVVRSMGKVRLPFLASLLSNGLNLLFSAIAVFVLKWGLVGVALGTVLARLLGSFFLLTKIPLSVRLGYWHLDRLLFWQTLPIAGERLLMRLGDVVVLGVIVQFGTAVVAGNAIGETLAQFPVMPVFGVATAVVMRSAQMYDEGNKQDLEKLAWKAWLLAMVWMGVLALGMWLFSERLSRIFTQDPQAVLASQTVLAFVLLGTPVTAAALVETALWQGVGIAKRPFYATALGMWLVRIGLSLFLTKWYGMGYEAIWIATIADNLFRALYLRISWSVSGGARKK